MLHITTGAVGAFGIGALAWPIFGHMRPAADKRGLIIDLSGITEGQQLKVLWQSRPVFIRHRTPEEIAAAQTTEISLLPHKETDDDRLTADLMGRKNPKYLVIIGVCPHFGCVPVSEQGDYGGWFCPCHAAHFDTSGRVRKGPPVKNMAIPPYRYVSETSIEVLYPHDAAIQKAMEAIR